MAPVAMYDRINPNRETWMSLARLPGIGKVRAMAIIQYRQQNQRQGDEGPFQQAADLTKVKGIGFKTVEKIKSYLVFD
jgi:competence protein ComEA